MRDEFNTGRRFDARIIEKELRAFTCNNSNYDELREYVGFSNISECSMVLWERYVNPMPIKNNDRSLLLCYKGYQMEQDMYKRIKFLYGDKIEPGNAHEVQFNDRMFQGHPDLWFMGMPGEIKSLPFDKYMPHEFEDISYKIKMQVWAYMEFAPASRGIIFYESRESGEIKVFEIFANRQQQLGIRVKVEKLVEAINNLKLPVCDCGKHG